MNKISNEINFNLHYRRYGKHAFSHSLLRQLIKLEDEFESITPSPLLLEGESTIGNALKSFLWDDMI